MINDEICKLRTKLNNSIIKGEDYDKIYRLSVELDELIAKYYITQSMKNKYHKRERKSKSSKLIKRERATENGCSFGSV